MGYKEFKDLQSIRPDDFQSPEVEMNNALSFDKDCLLAPYGEGILKEMQTKNRRSFALKVSEEFAKAIQGSENTVTGWREVPSGESDNALGNGFYTLTVEPVQAPRLPDSLGGITING